ncbi:MAG: hypothetical protein EOP34_09520, partial [Rickettsiales bacterium]
DAKWQAFVANPDANTLQGDPAYNYMNAFYSNYSSKYLPLFQQFNAKNAEFGRLYLKGIMEMDPVKAKMMYPDATFTMRVSYGVVKSYRPRDGVFYDYVTTSKGLLEKYKPGDYEFDLPARQIELIKKKVWHNYQDENTLNTLLHCAADMNHLEIVKELTDRCSNINAKNRNERTPLHVAAAAGHHQVVKFFLDRGADCNLQDIYKKTPLHVAAAAGHHQVIKLLLDGGANCNLQDVYKKTPLHIVTECNQDNANIIESFVNHGANVLIEDKNGYIALHNSLILNFCKSSEYLINAISSKNITEKQILLAVDLAIKHDKTGCNLKLLSKMHDSKTALLNERFFLHEAVQCQNVEAAKILIDIGVDINKQDNNGDTALHYAVRYNNVPMINLLSSKNANDTLMNNQGRTVHDNSKIYGIINPEKPKMNFRDKLISQSRGQQKGNHI